jgi:prolyl oligopeptidase
MNPSVLRAALGAALALAFLVPAGAAEPSGPPPTPKKPVTEVYHGVKVTDDYRWLEKADDPAVRKWVEAQDRYARTYLHGIPTRKALHARLHELLARPEPSFFALQPRGGVLFALQRQPPREQPFLITLKSADDPGSARVLLDPNQLDAKGKTAIDFFTASPDGKRVAVALAQGGSEEGTLYVYDTDSGRRLPDVLPRVSFPTAGGCVAWEADGKGFYYTRYPRPGERPPEDLRFYQQVYFHKLGTPVAQDAYVIGKDFSKIAESFLDVSEDGRYLLVTVQKGDGGEFEHFLRGPDGRWARLTHFGDEVNAVAFGRGDDHGLYLLSRKDAPRGKILRLPLGQTDLGRATTVVPESDVAIVGLEWLQTRMVPSHVPTPDGLYVLDVAGGPSEVRFFPRAGGTPIKLPLPPVATAGDIVPVAGDKVLLYVTTYTEPGAWYAYRPGQQSLRKTALAGKAPVSFGDIEVKRVFATSRDGTRVPMTLLYRKGLKRDGNNSMLLYAYGGFGISQTPHFDVSRRVWLEHGGVLAIANLRGGGEYGEPWHRAAMRTKRQNAYDDFFACARLLLEQGYTNHDRLAIEGGSNGGLLMGVALTQHPELFRAVVTHVGIYDMLRSELSPNGAFNVSEFGTVKDPEQFKALYAYSPLHHVKAGTPYPAVLLLAGVNDGRVEPANSYRMAARLQAATTSGRPVLLRVSFGSGHGMGEGLSGVIDRAADVYAFLFDQLGMKE